MTRPNLWRFSPFDPYILMRRWLFQMEPEAAHRLALKLLEKGLGPKVKVDFDPVLHTNVCGLEFPNPIGLAAGFDKNAEVVNEVLAMGFGLVEIGTITPRPQAGNPQPRMFRSADARAIINRLGFNSDGMDVCLRRLQAWHDSMRSPHGKLAHNKKWPGVVGINLGANKDSQDIAADYSSAYAKVTHYADYVTLNLSSPNTPGLREMQGHKQLSDLLQKVNAVRAASARKPPVFVKIAPDLTDAQAQDIADVTVNGGAQGLIVTNTTVTRPGRLPADFAKESGGLSGKPLFELSNRTLATMYRLTQGKVPIIGCGGISSGADAYVKIRAGASLIQIYSALVFEGPGLPGRIARELAALLKRDGFGSVADAVGTADKK